MYDDGILLVKRNKKCVLKDMTGKDVTKTQFSGKVVDNLLEVDLFSKQCFTSNLFLIISLF